MHPEQQLEGNVSGTVNLTTLRHNRDAHPLLLQGRGLQRVVVAEILSAAQPESGFWFAGESLQGRQ